MLQQTDGSRLILLASLGLLAAPAMAVTFDAPFTYTPPGLAPPTARTESIATGDFNNDGRSDLAVALPADFFSSQLCVYYQSAAGGLADAPVCQPVASGANVVTQLAAGDINGDGRTDIVAASQSGAVSVFRQGDDGALLAPEFTSGPDFYRVAVADANGDGRDDIIGLIQSGFSGGITVLYQNANGSLARTPVAALEQFHGYQSLEARDVTGDGLTDIVLLRPNGGEFSGETNVAVFAQLAAGGFSTPTEYFAVLDAGVVAANRGRAFDLAIGDVNGDQRLDVVVSGQLVTGYFVGVMAQNAAGTLNRIVYNTIGLYPTMIEASDVDGDGRTDILANATVFAPQTGFALLRQQPGGTLAPAAFFATTDSSNARSENGIATADINGDAVTDVVLFDYNFGAVVYPQRATADLSIAANAPTASVLVGSVFTIDVTLTNLGPAFAVDATASVMLPPGITLADTSGQCSQNAAIVLCTLPGLAPGTSRVIPIPFSASQVSTFTLTFNSTTQTFDPVGANNAAPAFVSVVSPNNTPIANAGRDRRVEEEAWVRLNGSESFDPDGDAIELRWEQLSGPPVNLMLANTARPLFKAPKLKRADLRRLVFQLTVTDASGATASDTVVVVVVDD